MNSVGQRHENKIGNAHWMDPVDTAEGYPHKPGAFWIGRSPIDDDHALGFDDDRHVLLVANTRSGKGRAVIANNLALWPGSIVSIDPKGENAMLTARRRGKGSQYCDGMGHEVFVLDPFNTTDPNRIGHEMRAYYNPLADLDPHDPELPRYAAWIAESMLVTLNKNDSSWDKKGGSMIEALILHVVTSPDFETRERNLVTVRRLLMAGDLKAHEVLKDMGIDDVSHPIELLWQAVIDNPTCGGILSDIGHSFLNSYQLNQKYFDSVTTSAGDHTKWIDSQGMRDVLAGSPTNYRTFNIDDVKNHPKGIAVYLCLPQADMASYARWQRMMVDLLVAAMQKSQTKPVNGNRVLFSFDEFAGLGKMDRIQRASAEIAGAGVKLFLAVQGLNQLKEIYQDGWETFVGSAGLQYYFDIRDNFTLDYLQKSLGETEIIRTTQSTNFAKTFQVSEGTSTSLSEGTSTSETRGGHTGWNKGRSGGKSRQWGKQSGSSSGFAYGPHIFFPGLEKTTNYGSNSGKNSGGGKQSGWQSGTSGGDSWSNQEGTSYQTQSGSQRTESHGGSEGGGTSQSIHKKPLLTYDEAQQLLARIDNPEHIAYPGLALVRIAGQAPMLVRRTYHDQDPQFVRCFDPHPDHPFVAYEAPKVIEDSSPRLPEAITPQLDRTTFSSGGETTSETSSHIEAWNSRYKNTVPSTMSSTINVRHPLNFVWKVITSVNYWTYWLDYAGYLQRAAESKNWDSRFFTANIFPGEAIQLSGTNIGTTIAYEKERSIVISYPRPGGFYANDPPDVLFIEISVKRKIDGSSDVAISFTQHKKYSRIDLALRRRAIEEGAALVGKDMGSMLMGEITSNFKHLIDDLAEFGRPIGAFDPEKQPFAWYNWLDGAGTLHFLKDSNGRPLVFEGVTLKRGDRVGFIRTSRDRSDEEAFGNHCLRISDDCTVLRTLNDGARIECRDRIFLYR